MHQRKAMINGNKAERPYRKLLKIYDGINKKHHVVIAGDLNARIGNIPAPNLIIDHQCKAMINKQGQELQ